MVEIVVASNNKNKIREISQMLKGKKARVLSLDDIGFKREIEETGETLAENAAIKARAVASMVCGKVVIADDSGLEVEYLAKAPGVYSARFAGKGCTYKDNNRKLLKLMDGVKRKERKAFFRTVVCVKFPDGTEQLAEGRVAGLIAEKITGENGFGYDPVFYYPALKKTFAQMSAAEKNAVSHRKKAIDNAWKLIKSAYKL
jgi:XTP/dITP diphosphohydrolase